MFSPHHSPLLLKILLHHRQIVDETLVYRLIGRQCLAYSLFMYQLSFSSPSTRTTENLLTKKHVSYFTLTFAPLDYGKNGDINFYAEHFSFCFFCSVSGTVSFHFMSSFLFHVFIFKKINHRPSEKEFNCWNC